ncbi:hypothetical protein M752DRAFT_28388 [Aspergillus phoenicis ATCC 13157]|uniref:Uncharacterized protein n=1 Tax=Aspergillus phoenicis ATCC 13157 TaxID=1353007 RepID=A0A370PHF6_ASPPH|nr:hypothetical protein M752DRAFT_28388 [Aspergillus phoenicis ATCC 13157]
MVRTCTWESSLTLGTLSTEKPKLEKLKLLPRQFFPCKILPRQLFPSQRLGRWRFPAFSDGLGRVEISTTQRLQPSEEPYAIIRGKKLN